MVTCTGSGPKGHNVMMEQEQQHPGYLQGHEVNAMAFSESNTEIDQLLLPAAAVFAVMVSGLKSEWGKEG